MPDKTREPAAAAGDKTEKRKVLLYAGAAVLMLGISAALIFAKIAENRGAGTETEAEGSSPAFSEPAPPETLREPGSSSPAGQTTAAPAEPSGGHTEGTGLSMPDDLGDGFRYDAALTGELYGKLETLNTNNTDPDSPYRSLTADFRGVLDSLSLTFALGGKDREELKSEMEMLSFCWPDDVYGIRHSLQGIHASVLEIAGHDAEDIYTRILLADTGARHYLFLRAYYDAARGVTRIYMVNGMVW